MTNHHSNEPDTDQPGGEVAVGIDHETMQRLGLALETDRVPDHVVQVARDSFTWRTIDEELAALSFDSLIDAVAGVRSGATAVRTLDFEAGDTVVSIEIDGDVVSGQVTPTPVSVVIESPSGTWETEPSEMGWFSVDLGEATHARLRFRVGDRVIVTDWFSR
jgi:hypothetical protein